MKKAAITIGLVVASAMVAVGLHMVSYSSPSGMVSSESSTYSDAGVKLVDIESLTVSGVATEFEPDQADTAIAGLWEEFNDLESLHQLVDWSNANTIFAVYLFPTKGEGKTRLLIGYATDQLTASTHYQQAIIPAGTYQHHGVSGISPAAVNTVWESIGRTNKFPLVGIERYAVDSLGQIREIQMQVLFQ